MCDSYDSRKNFGTPRYALGTSWYAAVHSKALKCWEINKARCSIYRIAQMKTIIYNSLLFFQFLPDFLLFSVPVILRLHVEDRPGRNEGPVVLFFDLFDDLDAFYLFNLVLLHTSSSRRLPGSHRG